MAFLDFAVCWVVGFVFYGVYLPLLIGLARISRRVPPSGAITVARWLAMPCLLVVVTLFGFKWNAYRIFLSILAYYVSCVIRLRRVEVGKVLSDRELVQALFVAGQQPDRSEDDEIELGEHFDPDEVLKRRGTRGRRGR